MAPNLDDKIYETKVKIGSIIRNLNDFYYLDNGLSRRIFPKIFNHIDDIDRKVGEAEELALANQGSFRHGAEVDPGVGASLAFRRKSKKSARKGKKSMRKGKKSMRKAKRSARK